MIDRPTLAQYEQEVVAVWEMNSALKMRVAELEAEKEGLEKHIEVIEARKTSLG